MRVSPILASLANVFQIPLRPAASRASTLTQTQRANVSTPLLSNQNALRQRIYVNNIPGDQNSRPFSQSAPLQKRKKVEKADRRVTLVRYHLYHPRTQLPRPLRLSRTRALRHWTIHRAWHLHLAKVRENRKLELERQYHAMRAACEELRVGSGDGGKLFRKSMIKRGLWKHGYIPMEYGRGKGGEWVGGLGAKLSEKASDGGSDGGIIWDSNWARS